MSKVLWEGRGLDSDVRFHAELQLSSVYIEYIVQAISQAEGILHSHQPFHTGTFPPVQQGDCAWPSQP